MSLSSFLVVFAGVTLLLESSHQQFLVFCGFSDCLCLHFMLSQKNGIKQCAIWWSPESLSTFFSLVFGINTQWVKLIRFDELDFIFIIIGSDWAIVAEPPVGLRWSERSRKEKTHRICARMPFPVIVLFVLQRLMASSTSHTIPLFCHLLRGLPLLFVAFFCDGNDSSNSPAHQSIRRWS